MEWVGKSVPTAKTEYVPKEKKKKHIIRIKYLEGFVVTVTSITIIHMHVLESIGGYLKITVQRQFRVMTFQIQE